MKLGLSYNVFDGEELLPFSIDAIRSQVDYLSLVFQPTSYFGESAAEHVLPGLIRLKEAGLVDEIVTFHNDLNLSSYQNEVAARNKGRLASLSNGCSHHITIDVDEFYKADEVSFAKRVVEDGDFDVSVVSMEIYFKSPQFKVVPCQNLKVTFIQKAAHELAIDAGMPFPLDKTRQPRTHQKCRLFSPEEITMHHMSYVRKDMAKKMRNSSNRPYYGAKFVSKVDTYEVGQKVRLLPDYKTRTTVLVDNAFGINIGEQWEHQA